MKTMKNELSVDFLGSQEPLTTDEEKTIRNYFKKNEF